MKELVIVGAGGCGREVLQWAEDINAVNKIWNIKGFLDDSVTEGVLLNKKHCVIGKLADWFPSDNEEFVVAIGNPVTKKKIVGLLKSKGAKFASIIHPLAYIGPNNQVGEGLIAYPGTHVTTDATIGNHVILISSGVGHDAYVGDYCTISAFCDITGGVHLGESVFLGSHVTIIPHRTIGDGAYLCAGAVIMTDVKENTKMMGNPARKFSI